MLKMSLMWYLRPTKSAMAILAKVLLALADVAFKRIAVWSERVPSAMSSISFPFSFTEVYRVV